MLANTQFGGEPSVKRIDDLRFRDEARCGLRNGGREDGGARGRWRSFSRDGCERTAFLATDDRPLNS